MYKHVTMFARNVLNMVMVIILQGLLFSTFIECNIEVLKVK